MDASVGCSLCIGARNPWRISLLVPESLAPLLLASLLALDGLFRSDAEDGAMEQLLLRLSVLVEELPEIAEIDRGHVAIAGRDILYHCALRCRVLLRESLRFGTAIRGSSVSAAGMIATVSGLVLAAAALAVVAAAPVGGLRRPVPGIPIGDTGHGGTLCQ